MGRPWCYTYGDWSAWATCVFPYKFLMLVEVSVKTRSITQTHTQEAISTAKLVLAAVSHSESNSEYTEESHIQKWNKADSRSKYNWSTIKPGHIWCMHLVLHCTACVESGFSGNSDQKQPCDGTTLQLWKGAKLFFLLSRQLQGKY